jgi:Rhodopirellula transposase DDE domain
MSTTKRPLPHKAFSGPVEIKIEHRMFSYITKNWRGRPITSYQVIVELVAATRTRRECGYWPNGTRAITRPGPRSPTSNSPDYH